MTPQEVKAKLKEDKEFLVGSLIALYRLQTEDEKASKSTARRNNVGFNGTDARFLSDISEYYLKRGFLTDKQMRIVRPKLAKYSKQIAEIDPEPMSTGWRSGNLKKKKKPTKRTAEVYDEEWKHIKIIFPYDQGLIHYIKGINGYKFCPERDYGENFWTIPLTIINVDRLLEKEFELSEELNKWYSNQINGVTSDISVPGLDHILRPFQKEAVSYTDSRGGRVLIADDMGLGKEQPLDCKILTPTGWKRMGDIKIGDNVIGSDGNPTKVKGVFPQGIKDAYKVEFSDKSSTECGLEHQWNVRDVNRRYRKQGFVTKTTKELLEKGIRYSNNPNRNKWDIPLVKPVRHNKKFFYIHPYMMGVLLGDGYLSGTSVQISNPEFDSDIIEKIECIKPKDCSIHYHYNKDCPQHNIVGHENQHNPILNELRILGLNVKSKERFITENYLKGSIAQRKELLRGLMDTDGSCNGKSSIFYSCNKQLANDVVELVRSLGGISYIREYRNGKEFQVNVIVDFCPFYTKRKRNNWKKQSKPIGNSHGQRGKFITNIEYVGKKEQQCISIDNEDGLYVTDDYILTHNTLEAIAWIQLHGENVLPAIIVCPASLKTNWMKEIRKFTDLGDKVEVLDGFDTHKITKPIVIVNYDILPQRTEKIKNKDGSESSRKVPDTGWAKYLLKNVNPKLIVADEVHKAKNKDAKRTQSLGHLAKYTKYFIGLTGTPIENKPKEIFQPLQMIKPTLFPSFRAFATRYCNAHRDRYGRLNTDGASNTIELNQVLTRECFAYNTTITLEKNGQKPIGEVVENEINDRVLSYDFETSEIQWRQIEAHAASTKPNKLVRIKHESGEFTCTPDHPIWTEEKGYVRAEEITPDLSLLVLQDTEDSNS